MDHGGSLTLQLALCVWAVYSIVSLLQIYISLAAGPDRLSPWWPPALMVALRAGYLALITPAILSLASRYRIQSPRRALRLAVHVLAVLFFAPGYAAVIVLGQWLVLGRSEEFWTILINRVDDVVLYHTVIVAIVYAVSFYTRSKDQDVATAQLQYQLAEAQLQALRTQVQPHFLFNTLNTISELVHNQPDRADLMINQLGELLRRSLQDAREPVVPLGTELETVRLYMQIQQVRHPVGLDFTCDVDPQALFAPVPAFVLQPLVENAVRHGVDARPGPGTIVVSAWISDGKLHLTVHDNGGGLRSGIQKRSGIGLQNLTARLQHMYGAEAHLSLHSDGRSGTKATVVLPLGAGFKYNQAGARQIQPG
jgi:signal transduction histidine kinase